MAGAKRERLTLPFAVLDLNPPWPALPLLQDEAAAAARAIAARPASQLRVLTWNVWFDPRGAQERQVALLRELLLVAPDVACLQEVLPEFAAGVRGCEALAAVYDVSPCDVGAYGCIVLARKDLAAVFTSHGLPTMMGRTVLLAESRCPQWPSLAVATTHLESLGSAPTRREQLAEIARLLHGRPHCLLCGDFNFDDAQNFGDWLRAPGARTPLENLVLAQVLPDFVDAWLAVGGGQDVGITFDGARNPSCVVDPQERMRYDRVLARAGGLRAAFASLRGLSPIEGTEGLGLDGGPLRPSDHFGVQVDFAVEELDAPSQGGCLLL